MKRIKKFYIASIETEVTKQTWKNFSIALKDQKNVRDCDQPINFLQNIDELQEYLLAKLHKVALDNTSN